MKIIEPKSVGYCLFNLQHGRSNNNHSHSHALTSKLLKLQNSIELNKMNSQTTLCLPECVQYSSFTPLTLDEVRTAEDRENMGCYFRCILFDYGAFYNGTLHFNKTIEEESSVSECYENKVFNGSDCTPFFEIWECFEIQFRNLKSAVSNVHITKEFCRNEQSGIAEAPVNKTYYKEQLNHGCFVRCVNIRMKVLKDNVFNPDNLLDSFSFALKKMVIDRMKKCHVEINNKFEEAERYSCLYFYYFNECNERLGGFLFAY